MLQSTLQQFVSNVLDPRGTPVHEVKRLPLAPRFNDLEKKTVYLVDGGFGGSYEFLEEMRDWFARNIPSVKTVVRRKAGNMFMDDPELWNEIKEQGGAMVMGVGG
ncbi:MAG: hypothetical protein MUO68_07020 [Desulfobacteraceae bacterium]|nr:hypothetical protein [Desulfobacteraceae bacterium]